MSLPDDLPIQTAALRAALPDEADWRTPCAAAGLSVRVDAAGNTFARWCPPRADASQPAVATGAQLEDQDDDRAIGLVAGLEAIQTLQRLGFEPSRPIEIARLVRSDDLAQSDGAYHAWVGLQTEPSGKLEKQNASVGIAMSIIGSAGYRFRVTGEDGDAGAVPMPDRRDALCAAAETIHAIEQLARSSPSIDLTATIARMDMIPAKPGTIPSEVTFDLELHDTEAQNRNQVAEAIHQEGHTIALRRGLKITSEKQHARDPAACDQAVIDAIEQACDDADLRWWKTVGRSTPEALSVARFAPVGLVLIPGDTDADLHVGVEVLTRTLAQLSTM